MSSNKAVIIIFIKNPELGKVKTRLAQGVGDHQALKIYKSLLQHTREVVLKIDAIRMLFYSETIAVNDDWKAEQFIKQLQSKGDLGDRMTKAFEQSFKLGSPVLIIGSDCAQINANIIEKGLAALETHDFVVGPAEDGGYYLIGMRFFRATVFENILWSTEHVLSATLELIDNNNWTYSLLPELSDIDYIEDWEKHGWEITD